MGRKHCEEKEKLLVTSNFSFSHSVFERLVLQTRKNQSLFGKGLRWDNANAPSATWDKMSSCLIIRIYADIIFFHISNRPEIHLMSIWKLFVDILVVKEGRLGRSPKASQSALPGQKCPRLPSREGKLGRFRPSLPSLEGKLGRPSQIALPGGQSGDSLPH